MISTPDSHTILKDIFGYDSFRPDQEAIVECLLSDQHVLAVMPTGSGKSMCFQIPALIKEGLTVVVSPLVALMEDQVAALKLAGVAAETINGSRTRENNVESWRSVAAGVTKILYLAPERLMTERMLNALSRLPVSLIAVDEAHCISKWGPAFRPEYEELGRLKDIFDGVPIAALTATADGASRSDIVLKLFGGKGRTFVSGFDRPNIKMAVEMRSEWKRQLLNFVKDYSGESGIVYCLSRAKVEKTALFLNEKGIRAFPYHAGLDQNDRSVHQDIFMTEPGVVMVATIAFGMGINKPDLRFVFHTDLPGNMEAYYQEIGRAGRDGLPADVHMLYGLDDIRMRRMFIDQEGGDEDHRRREHKRLDTLIAYCEAAECRRRTLLAYFGEHIEPCGNCDICLNPPEVVDGTDIASLALSVVDRTGQVFGAAHLIDVLRGSKNEKITKFAHNELPAYGKGKEINREEWRSIFRQMVAAGHLVIDIKGYGGLSMTDKGAALMQGRETFVYRKDTAVAASKPKSAMKVKRPTDVDFSEADEELYLALKNLRRTLAKEKGVPAYVVFGDRSLVDMAQRRPGSETEFSDVHGVGAAKLKKFGAAFLGVIAEYS
jgi:ATP-dependent DNA helicase RecQ